VNVNMRLVERAERESIGVRAVGAGESELFGGESREGVEKKVSSQGQVPSMSNRTFVSW
jgi:hypothetical protein